MRRNVAGQFIGAQLISVSDGSAFTGSVTVSVTGDAGTQATGSVGSGACAHEGNGFHTYAPAQAETNYTHVAFTFTGTGAIPVTVQIYTLDYNSSGQVAVGTNNDKTGYSIASGGVGSGALASAELNNIADAVLDRNMTTGTDSGSTTVRTTRQALRLLRNKRSIAAGTLTVTKEDDSTASWTAAVTTAAGDPIDSVDPAGP